jgi:Bacterial lectin/YDG domain/MBG domain (YGX type)
MRRAGVYRIFLTLFILVPGVIRASDALTFFNNWFVTGDYVVAGVGLRGTGVNGWATGSINVTGVPANATPISAFLYWSTVETSATPGAMDGYFDGNEIQGSVLGTAGNPNPACGSSGGALAPAGTFGYVYRADVLRYMPVNSNNIRQANGTQTVKLRDAGSSGTGLLTNGASLVVIYTIVVPGNPRVAPLRSVVIYNGAFTAGPFGVMTQNVAGFYQASFNPSPEITAIVANGQHGFSSQLWANGDTLNANPFVGARGARWDNPTYNNFQLAPNASSFSAMTTTGANTCLTFAAIVASVNVQDTDGDGLLDVWETQGLHRNTTVSPATFGSCSEYPQDPCENLPAMGANPNKQDVFIQIDWMHGTGDGTGGIDGHGTHDHIPQLAALSSVAATFALHGITMHFDVGNNYQGSQSACGNAACSFIIPAAYAQGGSDLAESTLVCQNTAQHTCTYPNLPYPALSFEYGFDSVRDGNQLLGIPKHFAKDRYWAFHYALFAHALSGPFNASGQPINPFTGAPEMVPLSYSGIANYPGGGFMVTLGLWRSDIPAYDQVGSPLVQSGTLMHEFGHNLGLGHAGLSSTPNCMPNYPSVMNYAYQTRGLTDAAGNEHIDYSYASLLPLWENSLSALVPMGLQNYRVRFFGPLAPNQPASQASQVHCNGSPLNPGEVAEVRLEGSSISTPDWSNGTNNWSKVPFISSDANYDGILGEWFFDQPDWYVLNLQQIGSGQNFGGLSVGALATDGGVYATDGGALATDAGSLATQGGVFATDGGAFATDGGAFATDGGVFATDGGALATDGGAFATDAGEIDYATLILTGPPPASSLTASNTISANVLSWTPPGTGTVQNYKIYRCAIIAPATSCTPSFFTNAPGGTTTPGFTDTVNDSSDSGATCPATSTCYNTTYTYYVTVVVVVGTNPPAESTPSNSVTSQVTHLFVIANNQTILYGSANPTPTFTVYGNVQGSLAAGSVTCAYAPATPKNVVGSPYPIVCSGPATTSATDGVTYNAAYLGNSPGVLTINPYPVTITAVASNRMYNGTTSSTAGPTLSPSTLPYGDTLILSETYDNANVGSSHIMTPAASAGPATLLSNYNVTPVTINTGVITPAPLTITANSVNKTYGTALLLAGTGFTTSTLYSSDTVTSVTLASAGAAGTAVVGGYPIVASAAVGSGLSNYTITYVNGILMVTPYPLTVTATGVNKDFDGTTNATVTLSDNRINPADTFTDSYASASFSDPNPGTGKTVNVTGISISGPGASNYMLTSATAVTSANISNSINLSSLSLNGVNYGMNTPALPIWTGTALQLTNNTNETASAWLSTAIPVASGFSMSFQFQITAITVPEADGFAFVIQSAPSPVAGSPWTGSGNTTLGTTGMGGYIGYTGIPNSIAVEFDTYYNSNFDDPTCTTTCAHVGIQSLGTMPNSPDHGSSANLAGPVLLNFADGNPHTATITYDGTNLNVSVDGATIATAAVNLNTFLGLNGSPAYVGFTAATGTGSQYSGIVSWSYSPMP